MNFNRLRRLFVFAGVLALTACAGGGETGTGATGNDASVGTITAFGSIWVNGVEFETGATQVKLEGVSSSQSALRIGMVVTVKGKINADGVSGTADQVFVKEVIKGPISAKGTNALTVLGQSVLVNDATVFESSIPGKNLAGLSIGNFVEVSGIVKSAGVITATRIDLKSSLSEYKLKGVVSSLDTGALTFSIGTLTVSYGGLNLAAGVLANGMSVEVKGSLVSGSGIFVAREIESDKIDVDDADRFEIEGYVTSSSTSNGVVTFSVNNISVQASATTKFSHGLATDLIVGAYVEVEGALQGGVLSAAQIEFKDAVKLESQANTVGTNSLTLVGMPGLTITADSSTEFSGVSSITEIGSAYFVKVRGRYNATTNTVTATRIEAESSSDDSVLLQGPIDLLSNPNIQVMGINLDTTTISSFEGDGVSDQTSFLAVAKLGAIVEIEGTITGNTVTWESIELED